MAERPVHAGQAAAEDESALRILPRRLGAAARRQGLQQQILLLVAQATGAEHDFARGGYHQVTAFLACLQPGLDVVDRLEHHPPEVRRGALGHGHHAHQRRLAGKWIDGITGQQPSLAGRGTDRARSRQLLAHLGLITQQAGKRLLACSHAQGLQQLRFVTHIGNGQQAALRLVGEHRHRAGRILRGDRIGGVGRVDVDHAEVGLQLPGRQRIVTCTEHQPRHGGTSFGTYHQLLALSVETLGQRRADRLQCRTLVTPQHVVAIDRGGIGAVALVQEIVQRRAGFQEGLPLAGVELFDVGNGADDGRQQHQRGDQCTAPEQQPAAQPAQVIQARGRSYAARSLRCFSACHDRDPEVGTHAIYPIASLAGVSGTPGTNDHSRAWQSASLA